MSLIHVIFLLNLDEIEEQESDDLIVKRETQAKGMQSFK